MSNDNKKYQFKHFSKGLLCSIFNFFSLFLQKSAKMGRYNKRLAAAKKIKSEKQNLSASTVLKTLAKQDQNQEKLVKISEKSPLMLEKPTKKSMSKLKTASKITKKDKMKIRKDHLHNKLEIFQNLKKEEKESLKRKKKAIIGDVKPITETLDNILTEYDNKNKKNNKKNKKKEVKPTKQKQLQDQMLKDMSIFQQVLKHPQYKENPFETITTHIENKMLMEAMDSEEGN